MVVVLIFGSVAGVILGLHPFKVFALAPVILLVAAGIIATGVTTGHNSGTVVLSLLAGIAFPQIGFFVAATAMEHLRLRGRMEWRNVWLFGRSAGLSRNL